jgi:hypothetical protein
VFPQHLSSLEEATGFGLRQKLRCETRLHLQMCTMESFLGTDRLLLTYGDCTDRLRGVGRRRSKCNEFRVLFEEGDIDV